MTCVGNQCHRVGHEPEAALHDHKHEIEGYRDPHAKTDSVGRYYMRVCVIVSARVCVIVSLPVLLRVPVLRRMHVLLGVATLVTVMRMIMVVMVLMFFVFHRVRIPSMLECLHAPQRGEKNARP
jgi:hypothetical protein